MVNLKKKFQEETKDIITTKKGSKKNQVRKIGLKVKTPKNVKIKQMKIKWPQTICSLLFVYTSWVIDIDR